MFALAVRASREPLEAPAQRGAVSSWSSIMMQDQAASLDLFDTRPIELPPLQRTVAVGC